MFLLQSHIHCLYIMLICCQLNSLQVLKALVAVVRLGWMKSSMPLYDGHRLLCFCFFITCGIADWILTYFLLYEAGKIIFY